MSPVPEDLPTRIELRPGDEYEFELPGLGMAGYRWEHELDPDSGVIEVTSRRGTLAGQSLGVAGASAPEILVIRAAKPGRVMVRLVPRRHWEHDSPTVNSHDIQVDVVDRGG